MTSRTTNNFIDNKYYLSTTDLVTIAIFAALGGIFSTFIGNLGRLIASVTGLQAGGGQAVSGLHIFWLVLVFLLIDKKIGGVTLCGIFKGFIEFFTGSTLGITVLIIASSQAIIFEIIYLLLTTIFRSKKVEPYIISIAAGFSSVSNIFIQINAFLGMTLPFELYLLIFLISFLSGVALGGYLGIYFYQLFTRSGILDWKRNDRVNE